MTVLDCSAVTCTYNKNKVCDRSEVKVEGQGAHTSSDTHCESFLPKAGDTNCRNGKC